MTQGRKEYTSKHGKKQRQTTLERLQSEQSVTLPLTTTILAHFLPITSDLSAFMIQSPVMPTAAWFATGAPLPHPSPHSGSQAVHASSTPDAHT